MTGYPTIENAVEALNEKASAYLIKPIDPERLIQVVEEELQEQLIETAKDIFV